MRIAMLDWACEPDRVGRSGLSDIVWDLGRRLVEEGDDVVVVGAYDRQGVAPPGLPLVRIDRPRSWRRNVLGQIMTTIALARAIVRLPTPDLVFAPEYVSIATVSAYLPSLPTAFTTPGNIYERIANGNPYDWTTTQVYKVAAQTSARRASRIIALSEEMRRWWIETGAAPERVVVIPLGIDTTLFRPLAGARERLGLPLDEEIALYAGRFSVEKNLNTLVKAAAGVRERRPQFRLHLIGGGPEEARIRALVRELKAEDAVRIDGWVPKEHMPDYYRAADVFALPSTSEPLARGLLEAMACDTLVVASASGGTPDIIRSGENGLLVESSDVGAWTEGIERALEDPDWRRRLAQRGRAEIHRDFTWPAIARRLREEAFGPIEALGRSWRRPVLPRSRDLAPVFYIDYVLDRRRPGASGLSDIVWDMATELVRQGGEAHVFGPYASNPRPNSGVELHPFPIPPPGYRNVLGHVGIVLAALREIRRYGRRGIVHAPEYLSTGIVAPLARGMPTVLTVPGSIYEKIASGNNPYDRSMTFVLRLMARSSARYCARVIATSRQMERWWSWTGTPRQRLTRIPLGVDTSRFGYLADARRRLGIAPDERILLAVGRINPENDLATLVEALPGTIRRLPTTRLMIAGTGPETESLQLQARRLGVAERITWLGWVGTNDLATYYSAADLFVFTARAAGLPRVMLEAMACLAPVLATAIAGVTDHIVDGVTGYLVEPRSTSALEARLIAALTDPRRREIAQAGQAHVCRDLGWEAIMGSIIDRVYRPLAPAIATS